MAKAKFRHLLKPDIELWEQFLKSTFNFYDYFEYDVAVGTGRPIGPVYTTEIQQMAIDLSVRRIDAVGFTSEVISIFEITTKADLRALGQAVAYPQLYRDTYPETRPIATYVVTRRVGTDLEKVFVSQPRTHVITFKDLTAPGQPITLPSGLTIRRLRRSDLESED